MLYMNVALIFLCNGFPKIDHPILEILKFPEQSFVHPRIRMPVLILTPWNCM
jgi:hypothetical protein